MNSLQAHTNTSFSSKAKAQVSLEYSQGLIINVMNNHNMWFKDKQFGMSQTNITNQLDLSFNLNQTFSF